MNNGKVRIYELSKELNLDNKDILEICDRLNIAVKSHSSTIDTSQAESIRRAAEKYTPTYAGNGKNKATTPENRASKPDRSSKRQRKQEILAVHHKRNRPNSAPNSKSENTPKLLEKPSQPSRSAPQQPIDRPTKPLIDKENNLEVAAPAVEPQKLQPKPDNTERETKLTTDTTKTVTPPQLLSPPVRRTEEDKKKEEKSRKQYSGPKKPQKRSGPSKDKPTQIVGTPTKNQSKDRDSSEEKSTAAPVARKSEKQSGKNGPAPQNQS